MQPVSFTETISRYILSKNDFTKNRIKYSAFIPYPHLELSIYRIDSLTEAEIWNIGQVEVANKRGKPLLARGDVTVAQVGEVSGLEVTPDTDPESHYLHANIINWPKMKSEQKLRAVELADRAQLFIKTD